jgi:hypothetical protein
MAADAFAIVDQEAESWHVVEPAAGDARKRKSNFAPDTTLPGLSWRSN